MLTSIYNAGGTWLEQCVLLVTSGQIVTSLQSLTARAEPVMIPEVQKQVAREQVAQEPDIAQEPEVEERRRSSRTFHLPRHFDQFQVDVSVRACLPKRLHCSRPLSFSHICLSCVPRERPSGKVQTAEYVATTKKTYHLTAVATNYANSVRNGSRQNTDTAQSAMEKDLRLVLYINFLENIILVL